MSVGIQQSQRAVLPLLAFLALTVGSILATQLVGCGGGTADPCADGGVGCFPLKAGPISHVNADCVAGVTTSTCAANEICFKDDDFPVGSCSQQCTVGDDSTCNFGGTCVNLADTPSCSRTCFVDSDCPASGRCLLMPGTAKSVCVPKGISLTPQAGACPATPTLAVGSLSASDPGAGNCIRPIVHSQYPTAIPLGAHVVGDVVPFTVPPNTASITILSQAIDAGDTVTVQTTTTIDNTVIPTRISLPNDGGVIFDDLVAPRLPPSLQAVFYATASPSTGALIMPNTSALLSAVNSNGGFPGGSWSLQVNDYAAECMDPSQGCTAGASAKGVYDITVVTKPGPPSATGTLDLGIYLVGTKLPTAAAAMTDANIQRFVQGIHDIYAKAGVCLGTVTFYDVPAWAKTRYASVNVDKSGPCSSLDQMFTISAPGNRINLFLVDDLVSSAGGGFSIVGLDGTIPGPATLGGTISSGAALIGSELAKGTCGATFDLTKCGADLTAYIAAHEAGHFLGLYHTSERHGESFDPLLDTPTCKCELCVSSSKVSSCLANTRSAANFISVEATDCNQPSSQECGGGDNLMFWLVDLPDPSAPPRATVSKAALTAEQGKVMVANPTVQ